MSEVCIECVAAQNKLDESRKQAETEGKAWAKAQGLKKYAVVLKPNRNGWKYIGADEPDLDTRFREVITCYL